MKKKNVLIATGAAIVVALAGAGIALGVANIADDSDTLTGDTLERASNAALAEVGPGTVTSAEHTDDGGPEYNLEVRLENGDEVDVELDGSFTVVYVGDLDQNNLGATSAPVATASAQPTADQDAANRASAEAAALAAVGSGSVTEFDRSDDADHLYEVEVTLPDGRDVDVELDATFRVTKLDDAVQ
ncbi:PepSY domain-containing protein [Cryobacterium roopkundense]|uniref:Putative membrane protein YkoI n=1 Tax=Cryobacterium roopkundense TaxID=1001240 RepID=A0A7W8ZTL9_9MICO|nr:PepSY domain-containing protein [Cryobacterium roopkundense]MBB5639838.1 putative membrane protein YkoI [Cryobacterium roopkundense]